MSFPHEYETWYVTIREINGQWLVTAFLVKYLDQRQWKEKEAGENYTVMSFILFNINKTV
jgi:hypothetical protein